MFRTLGQKVLVGVTLLVLLPSTFAFAGFSSKASNSSTIQNINSGTWKLCAAATSGVACNGTNYGPITPATVCSAAVAPTVAANGTGATVQLSSTAGLIAGMTVTGTGIASPGVNWIASISSPNVTLGISGSTFTSGNTLTFSTCTGQSQFLFLNNNGTSVIKTVNLIDTATITGSKTMDIQSCNTGGVGTTSLSWDTVNNLCVGQINILATVTSTTSPVTTTSYNLPIASLGSVQLRALSSQAGRTLTVSSSVSQSNLTNYSTNG